MRRRRIIGMIVVRRRCFLARLIIAGGRRRKKKAYRLERMSYHFNFRSETRFPANNQGHSLFGSFHWNER